MSKQANTTPPVGFPALPTLVFITLKLTHVIAWTWFWVLSPLWASIAIAVFAALVLLAIAVTAAILDR